MNDCQFIDDCLLFLIGRFVTKKIIAFVFILKDDVN